MSDEILWNKLKHIWETLSDDDRFEVLGHARWLADAMVERRLVGGPLDGYRIPEQYKDSGAPLVIKIFGKVAIYERDGDMMFRFCRLAEIGGEGGYWPDIDAGDLDPATEDDLDPVSGADQSIIEELAEKEFGDLCLNVGRSHFAIYHKSKTYRFAGQNLMSGWLDESPETWRENVRHLSKLNPSSESDRQRLDEAAAAVEKGGNL